MTRNTDHDHNKTPRWQYQEGRAGLSLLEFLGCLIAIVGGAWLGAIYLGVDVHRLAYTALAESDVLDKVPPEWRPTDPDKAITREQLVATLREELGTLRSEITALREGEEAPRSHAPAESRPHVPPERSAVPQPSQDKTLAYWTRVNEIVLGEVDLQHDARSALTEANAAKVFALKGQVRRFAAKAVHAIPSDDVDASLLQLGQQLAQWYDHGGALYERAAQIWELPVASQRAELTQRWNQADVHHRNEAQLIGDKATALRDILSHRFDVEFPPFAKPAPRSGPRDQGDTSAG